MGLDLTTLTSGVNFTGLSRPGAPSLLLFLKTLTRLYLLSEYTGPALRALGLGWGVGSKVIPQFARLWVSPYVNVTSAEKNLKCI